jgi:uncharacterized protein (DUF849 family)
MKQDKQSGISGGKSESLILNLAPTGLVPTRDQTPHVPITPEQIVADVLRCVKLGVAMVHIHARTPEGAATDDAGVFREILTGIRAGSADVIIVTTTSGRRIREVERRASTLFLEGAAKPDMASLTLGSMNFSAEASLNEPAAIIRLAEIMKERGIRPELEIFDLGMVNFARTLMDKGLIAPPYYFNIILGNIATAQVSLHHLAALVADLPPQSVWSVGGIGRFQLQANGLGVILGDGVRIGLEDNLWMDAARTRLASNADLVQRMVDIASAFGRPIASPAAVRRRLGLQAV